MKKALLVVLTALATLLPSLATAVNMPTGLTAGAWANSALPIYWNADATINQWYVYVNGSLFASPLPSQVQTTGSVSGYNLSPIPSSPVAYVINMRAVSGGQLSAFSSNITVTANSGTGSGVYLTAPVPAGSNYIGQVGATFSGSLPAGTNNIGSVNIGSSVFVTPSVGTTEGSPMFVSSPAGTYLTQGGSALSNSNSIPVSATIQAFGAGLQTTLTAGSAALNTALTADYDVNTKTVNSRRFNDTMSYYINTTGTTTISSSGYELIYSMTIKPSSTYSSVTLFDGAVTRVAVSGSSPGFYSYMRGKAIKNGTCTLTIVGSGLYDGSVCLEADK